MKVALDVPTLAHARWVMRRRLGIIRKDGADEDRCAAYELRERCIRDAAYSRWCRRGRPLGDDWADWFAVEAEGVGDRLVENEVPTAFAQESMRHQLLEEEAHHHWIERGQPFGDPETDWRTAEDEVAGND
jgi:Protein of unknown function (DUF2934)